MTQLESINSELNRLFDTFNKHYYNNEIQKPVIAVQTNGKDSATMGWCTCNKVWKDNEKNQFYYEITICSEYLFRNVQEICATLLHEMVHLYCNEKDIKNTSRGHTYHNKRFKVIAEQHGLVVQYDKRIGWSMTRLSDESKSFVEANVKKNVFTLTRGHHKEEKPSSVGDDGEDQGEIENPEKPKQSMRKYVCPSCGTIIRATKDVNVKCADCDKLFEKE